MKPISLQLCSLISAMENIGYLKYERIFTKLSMHRMWSLYELLWEVRALNGVNCVLFFVQFSILRIQIRLVEHSAHHKIGNESYWKVMLSITTWDLLIVKSCFAHAIPGTDHGNNSYPVGQTVINWGCQSKTPYSRLICPVILVSSVEANVAVPLTPLNKPLTYKGLISCCGQPRQTKSDHGTFLIEKRKAMPGITDECN